MGATAILGTRKAPRRLHANGGADFGLRLPRIKAQACRQEAPWAGGQLNEILVRRAAVRGLSTHQRRLEGARGALPATRGAGARKRSRTDEHRRPLFLSDGYPSPYLQNSRVGITTPESRMSLAKYLVGS